MRNRAVGKVCSSVKITGANGVPPILQEVESWGFHMEYKSCVKAFLGVWGALLDMPITGIRPTFVGFWRHGYREVVLTRPWPACPIGSLIRSERRSAR